MKFFSVTPGGPFWRNKDLGSWSIPKGLIEDETPLAAAKREFASEKRDQTSRKMLLVLAETHEAQADELEKQFALTGKSEKSAGGPAELHSSQIYFSERPHRLHRKVRKEPVAAI